MSVDTATSPATHLRARSTRTIGGFGVAPKFPPDRPWLELAPRLYRELQPYAAHIATRRLDAIGWGGSTTRSTAGSSAAPTTRDWSEPQPEKLLDVNAALLVIYVEASRRSIARYRERAADVLRYVQTWLADPVDGGWAGSQQADRDYYAANARSAAAVHAAAASIGTLYADWNATMVVGGAARRARVFDDNALGEFALKSLERSCCRLLPARAPAWRTASTATPAVRGLLDDQIAMAAAHLDAYEATGNIVYEMMAEELARTRCDDVGRDGRRILRSGLRGRSGRRPDAAAAEAVRRQLRRGADVLRRLAASPVTTEFAALAGRTRRRRWPAARPAQGPLAAHYVLAARGPRSQ